MNYNPSDPLNWFIKCGKYAIENKYCMEFGAMFRMRSDAPSDVIEAFREYLKLCKKPFLNRGLCLIRNNRVVGFLPTNDPLEQEQIEVFKDLVKEGFIDNDPFLKSM